MNLKYIKDIILSIFSSSGYSINKFNIQFPQPLDISISVDGEQNVTLSFKNNFPKISWKKFITLSTWVERMSLGPTGGALKLRYFPEVSFSYQQSENSFGSSVIDTSDIEEALLSQYRDDNQRLVAKKCLLYASEWATIASAEQDFSNCSPKQEKKLKNDCKNFIVANLKQDEEIQAKSAILTFLFFYVVLPVILKFIIEKLFNKLFSR